MNPRKRAFTNAVKAVLKALLISLVIGAALVILVWGLDNYYRITVVSVGIIVVLLIFGLIGFEVYEESLEIEERRKNND